MQPCSQAPWFSSKKPLSKKALGLCAKIEMASQFELRFGPETLRGTGTCTGFLKDPMTDLTTECDPFLAEGLSRSGI